MGDIYKGKRVIQAKITYKRGSRILGVAKSDAVYEQGRWKAGKLNTPRKEENGQRSCGPYVQWNITQP